MSEIRCSYWLGEVFHSFPLPHRICELIYVLSSQQWHKISPFPRYTVQWVQGEKKQAPFSCWLLLWSDILQLSVFRLCPNLHCFSCLVLSLLQWLTPDVALSVLGDDGKVYLTEEDYQRISTVLLYYVINFQDLCVSNGASPSSLPSSSENFQFYLLALTNLHPAENNSFLSTSETESILQLINQHYHPSNENTSSDLQVRNSFLTNVSFHKYAHMLRYI